MNARARGLAKGGILLGMIGGFALIPGVATAGNDGVTLAYVDGAWQVTLDSPQAWEVKLIDPAPQEIACGANYGSPCDATVYRFTSTADCVTVQIDWRNGAHNSTDPRACRDAEQTPTPEPTEPQNPAAPTSEQPTPIEEPTWTPEPTPAPTADPTPSEQPTSEPSQQPTSPSPEPEPTSTPPTQPSPEPSPTATEPEQPGSEPTSGPHPSEPASSDSGVTPDPTEDTTHPTPIEEHPPQLAVTGSNDTLVGTVAFLTCVLLGTFLYLTNDRRKP